MISKSVESAQKRVEGNNFDTRKHLVEYDDVINKHREAIYQRRREILEIAEGVGNHGDRQLADIVKEIINEELNQIISFHCLGEPKDWNLQEVAESVTAIFPLNEEQTEKILAFHNNSGHEGSAALLSELQDWAAKKYENLKESLEGAGINFIEVEKGILLRSIDQLWVEHLETMDYLRGSIGLRGYGQRDPLVEYKKEAYRLFRELNELIRRQVVYSIYKTGDALELAPQLVANLQKSNNKQNLKFSGAAKVATDHQPGETIDLVRNKIKDESGKVVGRNDLCPCGSGKKFKKCCGA